jgi:N-terminal domain of argonaute
MSYEKKRSSPSGLDKNMQALSTVPKSQAFPNGRKFWDINLVANYFAIELSKSHSQDLFQYTIAVQPQPRTRRLRRRAIYCWLQSHNLRVNYATNYHNFLVTGKRIGDTDDEGFEYWDEHEVAPRQSHAPSCRITITFHKQFNIPSFLAQLAANTVRDDDKNDMLIVMNMIFSQKMNEISFRTPGRDLQVAAVSSDKFFGLIPPPLPQLLGGGQDHARALIVAHSGIVRSACCPDRLLLNINNATGAFYREGPLDRLIDNYLGRSDRWPRFDLSTFLKGLKVKTTHLKVSKIYTISRVALSAGPNHNQRPTPARISFNLNGNMTTVGAYYDQGLALRFSTHCSC